MMTNRIKNYLDEDSANITTERPPLFKDNIDYIIKDASNAYQVPEHIIRAVINKESSGNQDAVSPKGARGYMQLMPATAKEMGVIDIHDPVQNIKGGTRYLKQQYDKFGSWPLAFAAYNAGPGAVEKYGGVPPFSETKEYVDTLTNRIGNKNLRYNGKNRVSSYLDDAPIKVAPTEAPNTEEGLWERTKEFIQKPLITKDYSKAIIEGATRPTVLGLYETAKGTTPITRGYKEGLAETVSGISTPQSIATGVGLMTPAAPLILAAMTPSMIKGTYEDAKNGIEALKQGNIQEASKSLTTAGINAVMTLLGAKGAYSGMKGFARSTEVPTEVTSEINPSKSPTVPETPETVKTQINSMKQGNAPAVLVTEGEAIPEIPKGFKAHDTEVGTWIYDPKKLTPEQIQEKVDFGEHGDLLGYVEPKSPETTATVEALQNGKEAKTAVVSPERVQEQAEVLKGQFPKADIKIGGPEEAVNVINKRLFKQPKFNPEKHSLADFIRNKGGINIENDPMAGEIHRLGTKKESGLQLMNNTRGLTIDNLREMANEAGFGPFEKVSDFVSAIDKDASAKTRGTSQRIWSNAKQNFNQEMTVNESPEYIKEHLRAKPIPVENLNVGDSIKIPGDKLRVVDWDFDGVTLKDGITKKVPLGETVDVVGGKRGIEKAPEETQTEVPTFQESQAKIEETIRHQKALDLAEHGRKPIPPQKPALEEETEGSNLFAMQRGLGFDSSPELLKKAIGGEKGAIGDLGEGGLAQAKEAQKKILKNFYKQEISKPVSTISKGFNESVDSIKKVFAPAARGETAAKTAGLMRENLADVAQKYDRAEAALSEANKYFQSNSKEGLSFIDNVERGQGQVNPKIQKFADTMREMLDERRKAVQNLGTGKLQNFYENYFPHYYEDPQGAEVVIKSALGKRPLEGPKSFLKKRIFMTLNDAVQAGLKPISTNPVDYMMFKIREMDRYIMAQNVLKDLKNQGLSKFVKATERPPEGYAQINDRVSTVYGPVSEEGAQQIRGHYYAPEQAATIINNYLSPGLQKSGIYRGWMSVANTLNQAQLGLSAFHLGFTSFEASISKTALALEKLSEGNVTGAIKTASQIPIAPVENILRGNKVIKEWNTPGSQGPMIAAVVDAMKKGGGRARMETLYKTGFCDKMLKAWREGNPIGAALRGPFAALEQVTKPILEWIVPRQKMGIFMDLARKEMERRPNMTPTEAREVFGKIWDSVDNRMGQMVYDNLFLNKTAKDLAMASVRSVGWNLGTMRELLGAVKDVGTQGKKIINGQKPELTHRMAYAMALPLLTGTVGAISQYLATGKGPQSLKDYFFPRTGNLDENGRPERISLPSYLKDVYAYSQHPIRTLSHKTTPLISLIAEMLQNKDYYGTKIWNEDDQLYQKGLDGLKHVAQSFTPFAVRGYQKEAERGGSLAKRVLPFVGITPAPSDINKTKTEEMVENYLNANFQPGTRTKEQAEMSKLRGEIRRQLKLQSGIPKEMKDALQSGKLSKKSVTQMIQERNLSPLQRHFKMLSAPQAIEVFKEATQKEKEELKPILVLKLGNYLQLAAPSKIKEIQPFISEYISRR